MKRLISAVLALAIIFLPMIETAGAANTGEINTAVAASTDELRTKLISTIGNSNIVEFCVADFDADGVQEAFSVVGEVVNEWGEDKYEVYPASVYFVSKNKVETVLKNVALVTCGQSQNMLDVGQKRFFLVSKYATTGGPTYIFGVSGGKWYEAKYISQAGLDIAKIPGSNDFTVTDSDYDANYAPSHGYTGHTWKPYYFYWNNGFKEYGAIEITEAELLGCNGAQEILDSIEGSGYKIDNILYRGNGIININYSVSGSFSNATLRLNGNAVSLLTTAFEAADSPLEKSNYGGSYKPAMIPDIATYPEEFQTGTGNNSTLTDLPVTPVVDSDEYIIKRVRSYTSDEVYEQLIAIGNSNASDEEKALKIGELFIYNGLLEIKNGVADLSYVPGDRLHYLQLTDNSAFSAYQYYNWLNSSKGVAARSALFADGLLFNGELGTWTNPLTYIGNDYDKLPGVAKYKDMLCDFMQSCELDIQCREYIKNIKDLAKNSSDAVTKSADALIDTLNDCKNVDELKQVVNKSNPYLRNFFISTSRVENGKTNYKFELSESTGYGKFAKRIKGGSQHLSLAFTSLSTVIDLLDLNSTLAVYESYSSFLEDIRQSEDFPWEMKLAAIEILQDIQDKTSGPIKDLVSELIETSGAVEVITDKFWELVLGKANLSSIQAVLAGVNIQIWLINQIVDVGAMVNEVGTILGYARLQEHYVKKLEESKTKFKSNQTVENAWEFYENYNLLYKLRYKGEEAVKALYKIDGFLGDVCDFNYDINEAGINVILESLKKCQFTIDENVDIPESVSYLSKAVIKCPVNVDIYAPDGTHITTLMDRQETDITNKYGRFAVVQCLNGEFAKVACFNQDGNYFFKLTGVNNGTVDFEYVRKFGEQTQLVGFYDAEISANSVLQANTDHIIKKRSYQIDKDGNGVFESTGVFEILEGDPDSPFADVNSSSYYYDAVKWALEQGITTGTTPTKFSPDTTCTRAQMVTFLWRASGTPKLGSSNPFSDVGQDDYFYNAVKWASGKNITTGLAPHTFAPNTKVTRGQTVTFLHRTVGTPDTATAMLFKDVPENVYYTDAVRWAAAQNITTGKTNDIFAPNQECTRAQIVTFLYRTYQKYGNLSKLNTTPYRGQIYYISPQSD